MKVLILSCNTGGGHNAASASLKENFEGRGISCQVVDVLQFISRKAAQIMGSAHSWMYRHAPGVFNFGYQFSEQHPDIFQEKSEIYRFLTAGSERLCEYIREGGYDTIMCLHVFSAVIMSEAKKAGNLLVRTCFVATDYTCSPSVEESVLDWYFIPDASLTSEFTGKGIPGEKVVATGIPVSGCFNQRVPRGQAKQRLGILPEQRHLLMMCGSMGCGPMKELAEELADTLPHSGALTVLCGTNEALQRKLEQKFAGESRIRVIGYTDQVSALMDSADLYLTKSGGLSISEALNKHLPMCLINAVAGCEQHNASYFVSRGMAVAAESENELPKLCLELLFDDSRLAEMRACMEREDPGNAAENIVDFLINGVN